MSSQTENSSKKSLETVAEQNRVSVYTVNFTEIVNQPEVKNFIPHEKKIEDLDKMRNRSAISRVLFRWRSAIAAAAILIVGILNFAFQMSFQSEVAENAPAAETSVVKEPLQTTVAAEQKTPPMNESKTEVAPKILESKKADRVAARKVEPQTKPRRAEIVPVKTHTRKKTAIETTAERLRRAERILTGV
jgi:type IV secretory pathway VirB10-like protein